MEGEDVGESVGVNEGEAVGKFVISVGERVTPGNVGERDGEGVGKSPLE